jgi:hypothetical protein
MDIDYLPTLIAGGGIAFGNFKFTVKFDNFEEIHNFRLSPQGICC